MKRNQFDKLIKKVSNQPSRQPNQGRFVDPTLKATQRPQSEGDSDRQHMFKEMKRREF